MELFRKQIVLQHTKATTFRKSPCFFLTNCTRFSSMRRGRIGLEGRTRKFPDQINEKVKDPTGSDQKMWDPTGSDQKVCEPTGSDQKMSEPTGSEQKVWDPTGS